MPRFPNLQKIRSTHWLVSLCLATALTPALAQTQDDQTAPTTPTQEETASTLPDMASIEQAWKRGDYVTARTGLEQLANALGTPLAQYRYGRILYEGRGGPRDMPGAIEWLTRAVEQDHLEATTLLARIYLTGETLGLERDPARAAQLLAGAAARGDKEAQYYLGLLISAGDGVPKDEATAVNWFLAAAEQEHIESQYALSRAYSKGAGVAENPQKALKWLTRAAKNGHTEAQFYLANAYNSDTGPLDKPGEALAWYRRAAENGHVLAARILGTKYMQGDGIGQNMNEALRWLQPAAEAGDPGAMSNLGYIYATGAEGLPADDAKAFYWYDRAAAAGVPRAMLVLGRFYETGRGTDADPARAFAQYRTAFAAGVPLAATQLARMQLAGQLDALTSPQDAVAWMTVAAEEDTEGARDWLSVRADEGNRPAQTALALLLLKNGEAPDEAAALLERAAQAGDVQAQVRLGQLYTTGTGVPLDYVTAHKWLNVAAASGSSKASEQRDTIAKLMTAEQIAEAQGAARTFFDNALTQPPATEQTVREEN